MGANIKIKIKGDKKGINTQTLRQIIYRIVKKIIG